MHTAPPTVPGMPVANSSPVSPRSTEKLSSRASIAPASAWITANDPPRERYSRKILIADIFFRLMTTPRNPPSRTRRLVPAPRTRQGMRCSLISCSSATRSCRSTGVTRASADPPDPVGRVAAHGFLQFHLTAQVREFHCLQTLQYRFSQFPYVTRPEGQEQVTLPERFAEVFHDLVPASKIGNVLMPVFPDPFVHRLPGNARDGLLARRVDVHDDDPVRLVECGEELLEQVLGARVPVGLEHADHPAAERRLGRGQCRADLGGMMAVVVHDAGRPSLRP